MKKILIHHLALVLMCANAAYATSSGERRPSRDWIEKKWEMRYVLFIDSKKYMDMYIKESTKYNENDRKTGGDNVYHDIYEFLPGIQKIVPAKKSDIATATIFFDQKGNVQNQESAFKGLVGKISSILSFVLIKQAETEFKPISFAEWNQGIPGDVSFSPALCTFIDILRYQDDWNKSNRRGNVGCREWTAQLYQKEPYIDVTTYSKKGNFIGEVVGWARFEDGPTPIIGMQGKQWLCLHECPAGEQPGVIPDMQAWTRKHGFPMPVPPSKQPRYPNKDYEDDLNEFWLD